MCSSAGPRLKVLKCDAACATSGRVARAALKPWDTLFTAVALKLIAFIGVVKGVVSIKLAHVLVVLAAPLACEYLVRVAAFVVGKCRDSGVWAYFVVTGEMVTNCYAQGATPLWVDPVSVACSLSSLLSLEEGEELLYSYQPIWWVTSGSRDITM